mmetsp:Transcript_19955/g.60565  ORF Transcript_19955/g.60565 Transcript_19955/m.60565 type:complete len:93 (-) Transcript_19955:991-1269(-)
MVPVAGSSLLPTTPSPLLVSSTPLEATALLQAVERGSLQMVWPTVLSRSPAKLRVRSSVAHGPELKSAAGATAVVPRVPPSEGVRHTSRIAS